MCPENYHRLKGIISDSSGDYVWYIRMVVTGRFHAIKSMGLILNHPLMINLLYLTYFLCSTYFVKSDLQNLKKACLMATILLLAPPTPWARCMYVHLNFPKF